MKQSSSISDMVQNNWNNISATRNLYTVNSIFPSTDLSGMPPALRYHWSFVKVSYKAACSLYCSVNQITRMDLCSLKTKPRISNTPSARNWYFRYLPEDNYSQKTCFPNILFRFQSENTQNLYKHSQKELYIVQNKTINYPEITKTLQQK